MLMLDFPSGVDVIRTCPSDHEVKRDLLSIDVERELQRQQLLL